MIRDKKKVDKKFAQMFSQLLYAAPNIGGSGKLSLLAITLIKAASCGNFS